MKCLPDIIGYNLKVLFIGFNPGLRSAETGHHYAGKGNNFWKLLYESGLTPCRLSPEDDRKLLEFGFGSTNIVSRPTRGISELKAWEYRKGADALKRMLEEYRPAIACFVGIGVYKMFTGKKEVKCGLQENCSIKETMEYVCPSTSGLNRMPYGEQLKCFKGLRDLL